MDRPKLADLLAELVELVADLGLDGVEPGPDELFLRAELLALARRQLLEVLLLQPRAVLERSPYGGVSLVGGVDRELGGDGGDRVFDGDRQPIVVGGGTGGRPMPQPEVHGGGGEPGSEQGDQQRRHGANDDNGV
ncbi:MAG: hypothetical protein WKF58_19930 [Ilumatobacteraceae bacterium]